MSSRDDLYAVLGVHPKASLVEIKENYRRLALECHPDKLPAGAACGDESEDENARFRRVQEAWRILSDFQSRTTYDAQRVGTRIPERLLLTSTVCLQLTGRRSRTGRRTAGGGGGGSGRHGV